MTLSITHTKVSTVADSTSAEKIHASDWNDTHTISGTLPAANLEAAGSNQQIQYNNSGVLGGDSGLVYDSSGRVLIGYDTAIAAPVFAPLQVAGNGNNWSIETFSLGNNNSVAGIGFVKTRGNDPTVQTIVAAGDQLLELEAIGSDGVGYQNAGRFLVLVDGSPAAGSMPGRIELHTTPSGSTVDVERMRIDSAGNVGIGFTPQTILDVKVTSTPVRAASSQTDSSSLASTDIGAVYLQIGGQEFATNSYRLIGFGYKTASNKPPAFIGFQETNSGAQTYGDLVFGTRSVTSNTAATEALRITSNGAIVQGGAASFTSVHGDTGALQLNSAPGIDVGILSIAGWGNNTHSPGLYFTKSRNGTIGSQTAVQNGDPLGYIYAAGSDGTSFGGNPHVGIQFNVDGSVSSGVVPTRIGLFTTTTNNATERLRIDSNGRVSFTSTTTSTAGGIMTNAQVLPTSDPHEAGRLWNSAGTVKVSTG